MSSDEPTSAAPSAIVLINIKIYFSGLIIAWIAFECLRRRPTLARVYACRMRRLAFSTPQTRTAAPGMFSWIWPALSVSDDEIVTTCGLDALILLRFLKLGRKLASCGVFTSCVLIPVFATAEWNQQDLDVLERISMTSMRDNDPRFW
jgi:hypothetical protein